MIQFSGYKYRLHLPFGRSPDDANVGLLQDQGAEIKKKGYYMQIVPIRPYKVSQQQEQQNTNFKAIKSKKTDD